MKSFLETAAAYWSVLRLTRVPAIASLVLCLAISIPSQTHDIIRQLGNDLDGTGDVLLFMVRPMAAALAGALALWFWARQTLRRLAPNKPGEPQLARPKAILPRLQAVAPVVVFGITLLAVAPNLPARLAGGVAVVCGLLLGELLRRRRTTAWLLWSDREPAYRWIARLGFLFSFAFFALALWKPELAVWVGPIGILFVGTAFWTTGLSQLVIILPRPQLPYLTVLAVVLTLFRLHGWSDNHAARISDTHRDVPAPEPVREGYDRWTKERNDAAEPIFVAAEGGGIYAAYHAAYFLARLHDETGGKSTRRIFMISGVSGGSVGAGVFVNVVAANTPPGQAAAKVSGMLRGDLLSPTLAGAIGLDAVQLLIPYRIKPFDRARALEKSLAVRQEKNATIHWDDSGTIHDLWTVTVNGRPEINRTVPALFLNTTIVETGGQATISPYYFDSAPSVLRGRPGLRLPIPTALFLSARFPFVSPPGWIDDLRLLQDKDQLEWRFVDGGVYENSGAETVLEALRLVRPAAAQVLLINSTTNPTKDDGSKPGDLSNQVLAFWNGRSERGRQAIIRLAQAGYRPRASTLNTSPNPHKKDEIPLGWMLSDGSRARIEHHVDLELPRLRAELGLQ